MLSGGQKAVVGLNCARWYAQVVSMADECASEQIINLLRTEAIDRGIEKGITAGNTASACFTLVCVSKCLCESKHATRRHFSGASISLPKLEDRLRHVAFDTMCRKHTREQ